MCQTGQVTDLQEEANLILPVLVFCCCGLDLDLMPLLCSLGSDSRKLLLDIKHSTLHLRTWSTDWHLLCYEECIATAALLSAVAYLSYFQFFCFRCNPTAEEVQRWAESFDKVMSSTGKHFAVMVELLCHCKF